MSLWACGNCSFEFCEIDTNNVQQSFQKLFVDSDFLNEKYKITDDSIFSIKEYPLYFDVYVDGNFVESFFKRKKLL